MGEKERGCNLGKSGKSSISLYDLQSRPQDWGSLNINTNIIAIRADPKQIVYSVSYGCASYF